MLSGLFKDASWGAKILISLFAILIGLLIFSLLALFIAIPLFHIDIANLKAFMDAENPTNIAFMKYFQSTTSMGLFIAPSFFIAYLLSKKPLDYLALNNNSSTTLYILAILLPVFSIPLINFLAAWNAQLSLPESLSEIEQFMKESEANATKITELFLKADNISALFLNIFIIALIPAIGEELIFRGVFQKLFTDLTKNKHIGIWIAAILFSAIHIQFYGFVPRMFLGALFGYLLLWSGNMYLPILAHFVNNAFAVLAYYLSANSLIESAPDKLAEGQTSLPQILLSLVLLVVILYLIYRIGKDEKNK